MYEDECEIASGSILLIIGIAGLFLTGIITCAISGKGKSRKEEKNKQDEDEKDAEEPTKKDPEPEEPLDEQPTKGGGQGDAKKSAVVAD